MSSPIEDIDMSDSDTIENPTFLARITPSEPDDDWYEVFKPFTLEDLAEEIGMQFEGSNWIVAREQNPKLHYHIVVQGPYQLPIVKKYIRCFIDLQWRKPRKHGFGNKQWCVLEADKPLRGVIYSLKEHDFRFSGFTQELIDECMAESFTKKSFVTDFKKLNDDYAVDLNMDIEDYMTILFDIHAQYGRTFNARTAHGYALSAHAKRTPGYSRQYIREFLSKN